MAKKVPQKKSEKRSEKKPQQKSKKKSQQKSTVAAMKKPEQKRQANRKLEECGIKYRSNTPCW